MYYKRSAATAALPAVALAVALAVPLAFAEGRAWLRSLFAERPDPDRSA